MGRWVVSLIVISGILAAGFFLWLRSQQSQYQLLALQGLLNDFQAEQSKIVSQLPAEFKLNATDSWSFQFQGDELWVQAPSLEKTDAAAVSEADFDLNRQLFIKSLAEWLAHRPGDIKRFPIRLRFRNEASTPVGVRPPSATPAN